MLAKALKSTLPLFMKHFVKICPNLSNLADFVIVKYPIFCDAQL